MKASSRCSKAPDANESESAGIEFHDFQNLKQMSQVMSIRRGAATAGRDA
jgi:hypothetical protein